VLIDIFAVVTRHHPDFAELRAAADEEALPCDLPWRPVAYPQHQRHLDAGERLPFLVLVAECQIRWAEAEPAAGDADIVDANQRRRVQKFGGNGRVRRRAEHEPRSFEQSVMVEPAAMLVSYRFQGHLSFRAEANFAGSSFPPIEDVAFGPISSRRGRSNPSK